MIDHNDDEYNCSNEDYPRPYFNDSCSEHATPPLKPEPKTEELPTMEQILKRMRDPTLYPQGLETYLKEGKDVY